MELQAPTGLANPVDQWIALLGLRRDRDLALVVGRHTARVSAWRRHGIPADVVIDLYLYAHDRGAGPTLEMLRSCNRRKDTERRSLPSIAAA